ncbi:MAG: DUF2842 domain-containing protein [Bosea sp.]|jgi:hypothetical protein|uniref:DUF2842 domain-containing protein n=1 Tax=Kaistia geumhonensis TaxID=410839 RepID=A0ABU0M0J5_9HYPH|nr:DUF2842 domain-containing protein [Kaistia geumhonensis]MBN9433104.1 DUF2842 domain-containing protein [Bosea sp. (in: a-proteobacteria)]MCX5480293.1 DUF2842 domain-containing protein [Kaistia geumhonensis]MDQ0514475.1 hypothetical protein [Kaistia geumhonensis]
MPERLRKFIGMIALVLFVVVYALVVVTIPIQNIPPALFWPAYALAGLAWVPPAGLIIRWMQKPSRPRA